jgi:hypothetical protein
VGIYGAGWFAGWFECAACAIFPIEFSNSRHRHCEPTGRANARPMTGFAKQSIYPRKERMDCFASLAMTVP